MIVKVKNGDAVSFKITIDSDEFIRLNGIEGMNEYVDDVNPYGCGMVYDTIYTLLSIENKKITFKIDGNFKNLDVENACQD